MALNPPSETLMLYMECVGRLPVLFAVLYKLIEMVDYKFIKGKLRYSQLQVVLKSTGQLIHAEPMRSKCGSAA